MSSQIDTIQKSWMRTNTEFNFSGRGDAASRMKLLRSRWNGSLNYIIREISSDGNSDVSEGTLESWFQRIVDLHSDISRHYHTLCHLEELFDYVDFLLDQVEKNPIEFARDDIFITSRGAVSSVTTYSFGVYKAIISLSIFFHDAIYNPKSSTNEEDSAELFQDFCKYLFPSTDDEGNAVVQNSSVTCWYGFDLVKKFILATKSHSPNDLDITQYEKLYLNIFLDADMSVLGKSLEAYLHYASLIRREYIHVPRNVYCEKRAEVLRSFIGNAGTTVRSKAIFLNETMRKALEETAVQNLKFEIEVLDRGLIPGEDNIIIEQK